jgi:hypothetical protein
MEAKNLRYIVFMIDSKIKEHDGKIFASLLDSRQYVTDMMEDHYADKAVIGTFYMDMNSREMLITEVETVGFKGDKKNAAQLELFNH